MKHKPIRKGTDCLHDPPAGYYSSFADFYKDLYNAVFRYAESHTKYWSPKHVECDPHWVATEVLRKYEKHDRWARFGDKCEALNSVKLALRNWLIDAKRSAIGKRSANTSDLEVVSNTSKGCNLLSQIEVDDVVVAFRHKIGDKGKKVFAAKYERGVEKRHKIAEEVGLTYDQVRNEEKKIKEEFKKYYNHLFFGD